MRFDVRIRETGRCRAGHRTLLHLELRQSRWGAWELELVDLVHDRRVTRHFADEAAARDAAEQAYRHGRQAGRWTIHRATDYHPAGTTSPSGAEASTPP